MRHKVIVYTICIFFIITLQSTVLDYIRVLNVKPNLLLVFVVAVAFLQGNVEGAVVGFFAGLSQDIVSGKLIGFYALLGLYLGLAVGSVNKRLYRDNLLIIVFFTFVSTILYEAVVYFLNSFNSIINGQGYFLYAVRGVILPEAVYNSVISVFIFIIVRKFSIKFEKLDKASRKY
ncbi:MAG TPA: rod shape-determining protein MreD [Clostridiaceae bacterium]|nr:rod shape-determining protein MreD [Clostridiaceae bacterium]